MTKYPEYAIELNDLLAQDQIKWKSLWQANYQKQDSEEFKRLFKKVRHDLHAHSMRMLAILDEIHEPSLSNIGKYAAQAVSVLALHDSLPILKKVLAAFEQCYQVDKSDTYYQAIPSMTDRVLILERKPQRFGTQWEGNGLRTPFLPTVEDFGHINERRLEYGIEALRWPKSLAIPESDQPWLQLPILELVMRDITDEEFKKTYSEYLL